MGKASVLVSTKIGFEYFYLYSSSERCDGKGNTPVVLV